MKTHVALIESVLRTLPEAIQPSQLIKAERLLGPLTKGKWQDRGWNTPKEAILGLIREADPTVNADEPDQESATMRGKYASWLLSQLVKAVKQVNSANWMVQNPEQALAQGLLPGGENLEPEHLPSHAQAVSNLHKQEALKKYDWSSRRSKVKAALESLSKIVKFGLTDEYDVDADINNYANVSELLTSLPADPDRIHSRATIRSGSADPLTVPGSEVFAEDESFVVFEITTKDAAMFHGANTNWCFAGEGSAGAYTSDGPLYVVYAKVVDGGTPSWVSDWVETDVPGFFKVLAISPYSNNVDTVDDYEDDDLWEIRDTQNDWFNDPDALKEVGGQGTNPSLLDVFYRIEAANPNGCVGFSHWVQYGTYDGEDIGHVNEEAQKEAQISYGGRQFMRSWGYTLDDVDTEGDIDVSVNIDWDSLIGQANEKYLGSGEGALKNIGGSWYVNVFDDDDFDPAERVLSGALVDGAEETLAEIREMMKADIWDDEYRERFREAVVELVQDFDGGDGFIDHPDYKIPVDDLEDAVNNADNAELDSMAEEGYMEWDDDELTEEPTPYYEDAAQNLSFDEIVYILGFDLEPYEFEEEDEDEDEDEDDEDEQPVDESNRTRRVMRRIITGVR